MINELKEQVVVKKYPPDRLCEYITGLKLDSPELGSRILEDRNIVRGKYNLLSDEQISEMSFSEYKDWVEKRMDMSGYKLRLSVEAQDYFQDGRTFAVTMEDDKTVYYSPNGNEGKVMNALEHELIHVQQGKNMPIEAREYESYIGAANPISIKNVVKEGNLGILFMTIANNVRNYYKNRGVVASWDKTI